MKDLSRRKSLMDCPSCQGKGTVTEDRNHYEFVSRDPITSKCLVCNGTGKVGPRKMLPNGRHTFEYYRDNPAAKPPKVDIGIDTSVPPDTRLNVSSKKIPKSGMPVSHRKGSSGVSPEQYEKPMFLEMALNPRLNKVLASGKEFLIVTETEPYYLAVYSLIREQERKQGSWTWEDEEKYVGFILEDNIKLNNEICIYKRQVAASTKEAIHG